MSGMILLSLLSSTILPFVIGMQFDNQIEEEPRVECGHDTITMHIKTSRGKPSYIFAKGHFRKEGCIFKNTDTATFAFDHCNVNRKREVNPKGMAYSLTVIVQLHPLFITKVDHAYNVRCFYMEANKEVNAEMGVSDLTTAMLEQGHEMPQCSYTLHRDSPNGPVLRYARVGDTVYHVWDCPSDVYGMLVHTCFILDGQGGEHQVIDAHGCSTDDFIIPQLTYSKELSRSFTGASVVNLPDRESIYFSCQIKLCFKQGDYCKDVTPPRCDGSQKSEDARDTIEEDLDSEQLIASTAAVPLPSTFGTSDSTTDSQTQTPTPTTSSSDTEGTFTDGTTDITITTEILASTTLLSNDSEDFPTPTNLLDFMSSHSRATRVQDATTDATENIEGSGEEVTSPSVPTTVLSSESTPARRRRTPEDDGVNIVDVDVSTPQLNIIDGELDASDVDHKPKALESKREAVCVPVAGVWFLSGISVLSLTAAIGALYHTRFSRRKLTPIY